LPADTPHSPFITHLENIMSTVTLSPDLERQARKRANAKLGWYVHALVFLAVNTLLLMLAAMAGRNWAAFPALGWAIGLAVHGLVVFVLNGTGGLRERLIDAERRSLQRDPW
jgi:hypothetical protein